MYGQGAQYGQGYQNTYGAQNETLEDLNDPYNGNNQFGAQPSYGAQGAEYQLSQQLGGGGYQPQQQYGGGYQPQQQFGGAGVGYQPQNMGGGMPMMNMGGGATMGAANGTFIFSGNPAQLQSRMDCLSDQQRMTTRDANITINGTQQSQANFCCLFCLICLGAIFILPLFCLCCDWWKKMTYPTFKVPIQTYNSLSSLLRSPSINHVNLIVRDNFFDIKKANKLLQIVQQSSLRSFTFINATMEIDCENNEISDFRRNMAPFKTLKNVASDIRWGRTVLK